MNLTNSNNLRKFKNEVGQSNHFLITLLIGVDGVLHGEVTKKDEFSVSWNPKDVKISALRSREYAIKSAMAWIIDNFDMYMRLCNTKPKLLSDEELIKQFEKNGRSIYANFNSLSDYFGLKTIERALVDLFICWRNRLVHYNADNKLPKAMRTLLIDNKDILEQNFSGLLIEDTLDRFDKSIPPSFKDIASLTKGLIDYVYEVDRQLVKVLDYELYVKEIVAEYLKNDLSVRLNRIYGKRDADKRRRIIESLLKCKCFSEDDNPIIDNIVTQIIELDKTEVYQQLTNDSFV